MKQRVSLPWGKWGAAVFVALLLVVSTGLLRSTQAEDCPSALIAQVNALRTSHGLPPYQPNPILMALSQAHSDYQASIQTMTHIGPDGSHPRDRARAAGYGGGRTIFVSENIAWGYNLTPAAVIQMWTEDQPHWNTMMGEHYRDIGAGCATDSRGATYYTIDAAYYVGEAPPPPTQENGTPAPTATVVLPVVPIVKATPNPDGSIIHIVRYGQTLSGIAYVYQVPLADLLRYNNMTLDTTLYPGEKVIVRPPLITSTPTETPTATPTATLTPTATATPTVTPTVTPFTASTLTAIATAPPATRTPAPATPPQSPGIPHGVAVLLGIAAGVILVGFGYLSLRLLAEWLE